MASSVFPLASTSTGPNAYAVTVPDATQKYKLTQAFAAGVYTITTSPTTSQATVNFFSATSVTPNTVTVSGTVTYSLGTAATGAYVQVDTGTNVVVSITLVANSLAGTTLSGTLDTITTTGNYNTTGQLYVLAFGGGGGAGGGDGNAGGGGGGSGLQTSGIIYANTATAVTIGAGGAGSGGNTDGVAGGTTNFGANISASGGGGGLTANQGSTHPGGSGAGSGGSSSFNASNAGVTSGVIASSVTSGTTGGGGGSSPNAGGKPGGGSGVGTGGAGSNSNPGAAGTGYASGGGAGGQNSTGGAGRPGVVYVLRGF